MPIVSSPRWPSTRGRRFVMAAALWTVGCGLGLAVLLATGAVTAWQEGPRLAFGWAVSTAAFAGVTGPAAEPGTSVWTGRRSNRGVRA